MNDRTGMEIFSSFPRPNVLFSRRASGAVYEPFSTQANLVNRAAVPPSGSEVGLTRG